MASSARRRSSPSGTSSSWAYKHLDLHPESLALLRQFNPDIRILAYVDRMAINTWINAGPGDLRYDFLAGVDSLWIACTAAGDTISYWANTIHPNVTERCPVVGGERCRDYFTRFIRDRLSPYIVDGTIDGIFIDEMSSGGYLWWDPLFDGGSGAHLRAGRHHGPSRLRAREFRLRRQRGSAARRELCR